MFNVGGGELLVIFLVALIVLGPQRLPDAARRVGNVMGELRRMSSGFQNELRNAVNDLDRPTTPNPGPRLEGPLSPEAIDAAAREAAAPDDPPDARAS
jgi:Tat protein translocase TatB subunit